MNKKCDIWELLKKLKELGQLRFVPNYGNMGDGLIAAATYKLFDENKINYKSEKLENIKNGNLVLGGGGYFCGYYPYDILKQHLRTNDFEQVVFLPNTFRNCDDLLELFDERYTVFCRDRVSFDYVSKKAPKT